MIVVVDLLVDSAGILRNYGQNLRMGWLMRDFI